VNIDVFRRVGQRGFDASARPLGPSRRVPVSLVAPSRAPRRGDRPSPSACCTEAPTHKATSSIPSLRSNPLGVVGAVLARMAPRPRSRPAGDRDRLAPTRVSSVLAVEECSRRPGRPTIEAELRDLILEMYRANHTWGAPRIHGELLKLGFTLAQSTVSKYLPRHRTPPSQSRRTFFRNHLREAIAIDFAVVPTATSGCSTSSLC